MSICKRLSKYISENMAEYMPENMPDKLSARMSQYLSHRRSEDIAEYLPHRMPDKMQIKCQLVGITWRKQFSLISRGKSTPLNCQGRSKKDGNKEYSTQLEIYISCRHPTCAGRGQQLLVEPLSRQRLEIDALLTAQSEEISGDVHVFAKKNGCRWLDQYHQFFHYIH